MKKIAILIVSLMLGLILAQCTKRTNPADMSAPEGSCMTVSFTSGSIQGDIMNDYYVRHILVYTPPGYSVGDTLTFVKTGIDHITPGDTIIHGDSVPPPPDSIEIIPPETTFVYGDTLAGKYYPVLYLLHGYGGNHLYFEGLYGLKATMDELINSGQIEPMIVVTPDAGNNLKGSFYTNSFPPGDTSRSYAGRMQDFITNEVVPFIDSAYNTYTDRAHRGISGHSMGGYGAIKIAMLRNSLFSSASAMSAPLTFYGSVPLGDSAFQGFVSLMPAMFAENHFTPGDTVAFYQIRPGTGKNLTNMMFAMGAAFSPHYPQPPVNTDTTYAHSFSAVGFTGYVDLPFDVNGQLVESIWNLWLANDVMSIFATGGAGVFDSTALYFDCGTSDQLYLQYHATIFDQLAVSMGVPHEFQLYSGFDDIFADHSTLIGERLKTVLKFHDTKFRAAR